LIEHLVDVLVGFVVESEVDVGLVVEGVVPVEVSFVVDVVVDPVVVETEVL
jgi:hypothetical protein